jgi:anti-sigma factor RsiW
MKVSHKELSRLYGEATARSVHRGAECLTEAALVRAAAGEISPFERAQLADHLSTCSDCAQEYRLALSLGSWAQQAAGLSVDADAPTDVVSERPGMAGIRRQGAQALWGRSPFLSALAASLLIVSVGLSGWVVSFRRSSQLVATRLGEQLAARDRALEDTHRQLAEAARRSEQDATQVAALRRDLEALSQPQLNEPVIDLDPRDSTRGLSTHAPRTLRIPATATVFTLVLNSTGQPSSPDYGLDILDQHGGVVWTGRGLHESPFATFTVAVPQRLLPAGRYRLTLYGLRGGRRDVIEDYGVVITYQ